MRIGPRLKSLREEKEFSQTDLAKRADVHRVYISLLERDERSPTVEVLERICKALNIRLSEFFRALEKSD